MAEYVIGRRIEADPTGTYATTEHTSWRMIDYGEGGLVSEDPVFGPFMIGASPTDRVIAGLLRTPASLRTFGIAQLSKLDGEGAIPNITAFSTAGGNVGQLPFIRFVADQLKVGEEEYLAYVIAQSITDTAHGPLRHVTDMEAEGLYGRQVFHDTRKMETYRLGGISDVFESHQIKLDDAGNVAGIDIPPAIESSSPRINSDNLQYVPAEIYEMFSGLGNHPDPEVARQSGQIINRLQGLRKFAEVLEIDKEGDIVFKDPSTALFFQKCQMIASTEDWKDPIARVLTHQYVADLKYYKIARLLPWMTEIDNGLTLHPHSYMYYVDPDVASAQSAAGASEDPYPYVSRNLKKHISQEERERFVNYKARRYAEFLCDDEAVDYPNEHLNGHVVKYGPLSSRVEILGKENVDSSFEPVASTGAVLAPPEMQSEEGVTYILDPLKNRAVRPFVRNERGDKVFLDQLDGKLGRTSKGLFDQHQQLQWQRLTVRLVTTRDYAKVLKSAYERTGAEYRELFSRPRMSDDQTRRLIGRAAASAKEYATASGLLVIAA